MIIGIDIREIRPTMAGKGRLTDELVRALLTIDSNNTYYLFGFNKPALAYSSRVRFIQLQGKYGLWLLDLRKKIKKYKVDVFLSPTSYLVVLFSPVPTVMIVSDLAVFIEKHAHPTLKVKVIEKTTFKLAARKARSITAVSEYTKYTITKYFGISPSKITVTPLAVMTKKTLVTGQKIVA
ncbi:glycosyltransferase family 4 protein, partial [Candidatus Berkelbacteria bacterium]|nr:glycosyltransferase family 4 protein [Candidatus Berkelbacteria bacterium]